MRNNTRIDEIRKNREVKARKRKIILFSVLTCVVLIAGTLCFMLMAPSFNISNIVCEGNLRVSSDEIISSSQIGTGVNILSTNFGTARKTVSELKYIESCNISRKFPNTVIIHVEETNPAAYFSYGSNLAVTDTEGFVIQLVNSSDTSAEIVLSKITAGEPEPSTTPEKEETKEKDSNIWGYDQDGDPIYKVNGGHYEFDDDGKKFFVDDSVATESPELEEAVPEATYSWSGSKKFLDLPKTSDGTVIFDAPIIYGVDITQSTVGDKIKSGDKTKLELAIRALKALENEGLLERTTQINLENISDVKIYIEDRLEILFGSFEDFEYRAKFVTNVINSNLSKYEHAILDYRDSKLYVRSADTTSPSMIEKTPAPGSKPKITSSPSPDSSDDEDEDYKSTDAPKSTSSPKPTNTPKISTPSPNPSMD